MVKMMGRLMSRKGFSNYQLLIVAVGGLVCLALLFYLFMSIGKSTADSVYDQRCAASVLAYSRVNSLPFGDEAADAADIECPTRFIMIEDGSQRVQKRQVANLMANCWKNYGEGRLLLFSATDTKFCAMCSVFRFEDENERIIGFPTYLLTERIPWRDEEGFAPTYYDYIAGGVAGGVNTGTITDDPAMERASLDTNYLDGSKRYAVFFTYYKESWWYKLRNFLIAAGITIVVVAGATAFTVFTAGVGSPLAVIAITSTVAGVTAGGAAAAGTTSADWHARLMLAEYTPENIEELGCEELPISMVDPRFR